MRILQLLLVTMSSVSTAAAKVVMNPSTFAGTWRGRGMVFAKGSVAGQVATTYEETAIFEVTRQTPEFLLYRMHQDTKNVDPNHPKYMKPMHTETGFCKVMFDTGKCTMTQAHPFPSGMVSEISVGEMVDDDSTSTTLTLQAKDFHRANAASDADASKQVTGFKRVYKREGENKLSYDQYLSSGGCDLFHHLHCEMERVVIDTNKE